MAPTPSLRRVAVPACITSTVGGGNSNGAPELFMTAEEDLRSYEQSVDSVAAFTSHYGTVPLATGFQ